MAQRDRSLISAAGGQRRPKLGMLRITYAIQGYDMRRSVLALLILASAAALPRPGSARARPASPPLPERAVRRTIPLTNTIRRAFAAQTRDSTGRPGRNYWQLSIDYDINTRLDPATGTVSGRETAVIHNTSP